MKDSKYKLPEHLEKLAGCLVDEEMLDILGSLLVDDFYASEIWQPWRDVHPTKEDLLKKEVKIELPKRIPFPDGIPDQAKDLLLYLVFPSLPFDEYVSLAMSLFRLFLDAEKAIKSFRIFSSDDIKRLKSDFEEFNIVAHHIKPRVSYESHTHQLSHVVSSLFRLCYDMENFTEKKQTCSRCRS